MRPVTALMSTIALALAAGVACQKTGTAGQGAWPVLHRVAGPAATPAAPASPWLDASKVVDHRERGVTPAGVELRQAVYSTAGGRSDIVLLLRDYAARSEGRPDMEWLVDLAADGAAQRVPVPDGGLPVQLLAAPSRQAWGVVTFAGVPKPPEQATAEPRQLAEQGKTAVADAPAPDADTDAQQHGRGYLLKSAGFARWQATAGLSPGQPPPTAPEDKAPGAAAPAPAGKLAQFALGEGLCPAGYSGDKLLFCRTLGGTAVAGGLVQPRVDWTSQAEYVPLDGGDATLTSDPAYLVNPDGSAAAGLAPPASPGAQPVWELHSWAKTQGSMSRVIASLAAPVAGYSPWLHTLAWLDPRNLAALSVLPAGQSGAEGSNLRLVDVDSATGAQHLVAAHLPAGSEACAGDGVVFYAVEVPGKGDAAGWQVWVSGSDGLAQRLVYSFPAAVTVSVLDVLDGRALLNRQYFDEGAEGTVLRNQLIEISLAQLTDWRVESTALASPLGPAPAPPTDAKKPGPARAKPQSPSGGEFIPDSPDDGGGRYDRHGDDPGSGNGGNGGGSGPPRLPPLAGG